MQKLLTFAIFNLLLFCNNYAQTLQIGLFNDIGTKAFVFSATEGNYLFVADGRAIQTIKSGQNLLIEQQSDSVYCMSGGQTYGPFEKVKFSSMADSSGFSLRPLVPPGQVRYYNSNLEVYVGLGKMQAVNLIDVDNYIAGVVEAESGVRAKTEFYKAQAVLCRTYALSHLDRHIEEGFNLCDGVHCQAYKGRHTGTKALIEGAFGTRGLVVTDADSVLITAAFHSNCGGVTESSENVWLKKTAYLRPIQDPYCQNQKNYRWEKTISVNQWKNYLERNGYQLPEGIAPSYFNHTQFSRKQYYKLGRDSVTFRKIRNDFKFRSAFFSIEAKGNTLHIYGRGYGHGAGMCQEGAMQMAVLNYNYKEIIDFYYQAVNVVNFIDVPESKNPSLKLLQKHAR